MATNIRAGSKTFTDFKKRFYQAFDNPEVFDCQEFNLLKVVQEGLKVQYQFRTWWGKGFWLYQIAYFFKRITLRLSGNSNPFVPSTLASLRNRPYLILDVGRYVKTDQGTVTSPYFHAFLESIPVADRVFGLERTHAKPQLAYDFNIQDYLPFASYLPISQEEKELYLALTSKWKEWQQQLELTAEEFAHIRCGLAMFWTRFRVWNYLIKQLSPKTCFVICHYHKEGQILAFRRQGVKIIELQHGLIAEEDIFYVYPKRIAAVASKALFADEIWTYGQYWNEVLMKGAEYPSDRIRTIGYYQYEKSNRNHAFIQEVQSRAAGAPILLITTQTNLYQIYIEYVQWLSKDLLDKQQAGLILVKPHPANKEGTFDILKNLPNVLVSRDDLYDLFTASDLHLSIYSTTLFEATRMNLVNFALYEDSCTDYVDSILASGVAQRIDWGQNPFDRIDTSSSQVQSENYFAPFSSWPELLMPTPTPLES
ncbi:MAG: hypothetical protein AAF587_03350 [Bacteroidota bacterium]